ncbi:MULTISPECIES: hypothetical protein [unclassified Janthinobacterium]|nr:MULTISPECIES: hypothetical protein [unclassified Janthinobacterium]MEC5159605.1 hypothetical protein [Janthinobacterium sp. CG_S6]
MMASAKTRARVFAYQPAGAREGWQADLARYREIAHVSCKKAHENVLCWLRIDKVFVYFMRLKMRALECAVFSAAWHRKKSQIGIQIHTDMHKPTPFFSAAMLEFFQAWRFLF